MREQSYALPRCTPGQVAGTFRIIYGTLETRSYSCLPTELSRRSTMRDIAVSGKFRGGIAKCFEHLLPSRLFHELVDRRANRLGLRCPWAVEE